QESSGKTNFRLSKPLLGDDGRIYSCSDRNLYAFESNGSIAWTLNLGYSCNPGMAPVHGGRGKMYMVAENRVLKISFLDVGKSPQTAEVFFGPEKGQRDAGDIIGVATSTLTSSVFITIKNRGLFAYKMRGQLQWSVGPMLSQFGYRLGCRKGIADCFFASVPVIDQCEASIYIANTAGEVYSLSIQNPYFNWVQDLSSFDRNFTITPGNNGRLYITVPNRSLVLALDVSTGEVLWQINIGPLSTAECEPIVDSNGWISIGSLDGLLYSISPTGYLNKFTKVSEQDYVIQASPYLDCSGYAVYISQAKMEGKVSHIIGQETYVSAMKPIGVVLTLLVPATGAIYWSETYPGHFQSSLSQSDLQNFVLDEGILLAFLAASGTSNPIPCRSKYQKLTSSCSQARPKHQSIQTGHERTILVFLLFQSMVLVVFAGLVRFCCIFWRKKKLQGQGLGIFLEKRRSLHLKKKELDRTITELEQKAAEEAASNEVIEELGGLVQEREGIQRKLSTTYSLGRDRSRTGLKSKSLLPMYDGKTRSYSFQNAKKESVTIFHTLSDTSSRESSSEKEYEARAKAKAPVEAETSSEGGNSDEEFKSSSEPSSSSRMCISPMSVEQEPRKEKLFDEGEIVESSQSTSNGSRSLWLKKRKTLSSIK
ncbi:hypothetical protein Tsubulata_005089, partial [Turnera subulata]